VAAIVKKQPFETVELYDHPSHALKAMGDLIEDLHADRSKLSKGATGSCSARLTLCAPKC
jgi:hypothetical protein